jgi:hypothetical protein
LSSFQISDPVGPVTAGTEAPPSAPPPDALPPGAESPFIPTGAQFVQVVIDDEDVTDCVQSGSITPRLNRPRTCTLRMFTHCTVGTACSRVKVYIGSALWFHGFVNQISTQAGEDGNLMSEYTCSDPMSLWKWRPARDGEFAASLDVDPPGVPGDFSNPQFMRIGYAPQIMYEILNQSINGSIPSQAEGTLFIEFGTFAGGITNVSGAPVDWPMTIAEIFELLSSTGVLDCVLTPIDSGGNMARLDVYNGDYGTDRTSTVAFEYATGSHNVKSVRMTEDSSNVCNKLWYYLGPRVKTPLDPAGDQHWRANITGDDPNLPTPPGGDTNPAPPGGYTGGFAPGSDGNPLGARILESRESCGVRMEVRIYDAQGEEDPNPSDYRWLWRRLWQMEAWLRSVPRTLVHITPVRISESMMLPPDVFPVSLGAFDIGDLVTVTAGDIVRGGFSGAQRIYEYTVTWDEDGVIELGELLTSSDSEGAVE